MSDAMAGWIADTSPQSADVVVPLLCEIVRPASVVDVGCGLADWLATFIDAGVADVLGLDTAHRHLSIPDTLFRVVDLADGFSLERTFELALCLEVGEHLPLSAASPLVDSLVRAAPVVAFSAAIPGQGGIGHVNEQWADWWSALFATHDYVQFDVLRPRLWEDARVASWYRQNLFLYAHPEWASERGLRSADWPRRLVHPELFATVWRRSNPANHGAGALLKALPRAVARSARRRALGEHD